MRIPAAATEQSGGWSGVQVFLGRFSPRSAAHELMMAAERGGILMLAELAMRQALAHGRPLPAPAVCQCGFVLISFRKCSNIFASIAQGEELAAVRQPLETASCNPCGPYALRVVFPHGDHGIDGPDPSLGRAAAVLNADRADFDLEAVVLEKDAVIVAGLGDE